MRKKEKTLGADNLRFQLAAYHDGLFRNSPAYDIIAQLGDIGGLEVRDKESERTYEVHITVEEIIDD